MVTIFYSMYTIVLLFYFISFKNINSNLIYLFKLQHLLHNQINSTVKLMKKKQSQLKYKRVQEDQTTSVLPIGTPSWCLNKKALEKFNCATDNISYMIIILIKTTKKIMVIKVTILKMMT